MKPKRTINLAIPEDLLKEFNEVCAQYGHGKQKGLVLSAAILMFIKADPRVQGKCLEQVITADVVNGVNKMIQRAKQEQQLEIATLNAAERAGSETSTPPASPRGTRQTDKPRKAAKKKSDSKRPIKKLPKL